MKSKIHKSIALVVKISCLIAGAAFAVKFLTIFLEKG